MAVPMATPIGARIEGREKKVDELTSEATILEADKERIREILLLEAEKDRMMAERMLERPLYRPRSRHAAAAVAAEFLRILELPTDLYKAEIEKIEKKWPRRKLSAAELLRILELE